MSSSPFSPKVPRIGKRVARASTNPYDAFRFRFNDGSNWFGRGLAGGNAGFRYIQPIGTIANTGGTIVNIEIQS